MIYAWRVKCSSSKCGAGRCWVILLSAVLSHHTHVKEVSEKRTSTQTYRPELHDSPRSTPTDLPSSP